MSLKRFCALLFILILPVISVSAQSRKVRKAIRRAEKHENMDERFYEKKRKAALKHRYEIQAKDVRKRMKESQKKAEKYNNQGEEPFYRNLFKKQKRKHRKR